MPPPNRTDLSPPTHIARRLPLAGPLYDTLLNNVVELPVGSTLVRAAWNHASIFPRRVDITHRFGPPQAARNSDGSYPFHWIYAAFDTMTAVWEAGLCRNDVTQPGSFYVAHGAPEALIARFDMLAPLVLLDLNGLAMAKLGISDEISDPDHEWSQWFGCMLDAVIALAPRRLHGFRYPSRRHRGNDAVALSSRRMETLDMAMAHEKFAGTAECAHLQEDLCRVAPP